MEVTNIALQEVSIPNYMPAESFNNKSMHEPSKKMDFNAVMETLEHTAKATEQPAQTKANDDSLLFDSEPKIIAELNTAECVDNSEVPLYEELAVTEEQDKNSELLTDTAEELEAEPNKKREQENVLLLLNPAVARKNTQSSSGFEPKLEKGTQTVSELVYNSSSCKKKLHEPEVMTATSFKNNPEVLFEEQLLQPVFVTDEEHECGNGSYYEQFEDLMLPNSEVAEFAKDSDLKLHVKPEPVTFEQDVTLQSEKLVHNVWQEADVATQLKESNVQNLQAKQLQVLSSEAKKLDDSFFGYEDLEQELATAEQADMLTTYEQETAEQDENGLNLTSSGEDFEPYATAQNIQGLSQVKDGYYDVKTARVVTKQIAFNIEKAIAEIENSQPVKIQMSLTPKELGTLVINFVVEEGKIAMLTIAASNQHTKELISKNMVMLQQELDKSGFEVKTVEVFGMGASNSGSSTESGQRENQERQQEAYEQLLQKDFKHEFVVNFGKRGEIA
ncbi:MAG: flagellar hook-length control protein FliK [Oscillospiraceae bacterium]|nr:flagellar hook-length control protein FliK [Oscillospiraceae bacterium]